MKSKITQTAAFAVLSLTLASVSNAQTYSFTGFNNVDGLTNTVLVDGVTTGLNSITKTTVDTDNYQFAFNYSIGAETLTFNLIVEGFVDGTITTSLTGIGPGTGGAATIGTTSAAVGDVIGGSIIGAAFGVGTTMPGDSSLLFTVTDLTYSGGSALFTGFSAANVQESASFGHQTVVGAGTGLFERQWNVFTEQAVTTGDVSELYISAASTGEARWGVSSLDFGVTVTAIPEPGSYALFAGLLGLSFAMVRRRKS